jgi:DNA-binding NarL/FixJ family response regulator
LEILVAVKSKEVRSALKALINQNGNKDKIIDTVDMIDFLKKLKSQKLRLVLIDWEFFDSGTIEMITLFKKAYTDINFIVLGMNKKDRKSAIDASIDAFYLKSDPPKELINRIRMFRNKHEAH